MLDQLEGMQKPQYLSFELCSLTWPRQASTVGGRLLLVRLGPLACPGVTVRTCVDRGRCLQHSCLVTHRVLVSAQSAVTAITAHPATVPRVTFATRFVPTQFC